MDYWFVSTRGIRKVKIYDICPKNFKHIQENPGKTSFLKTFSCISSIFFLNKDGKTNQILTTTFKLRYVLPTKITLFFELKVIYCERIISLIKQKINI